MAYAAFLSSGASAGGTRGGIFASTAKLEPSTDTRSSVNAALDSRNVSATESSASTIVPLNVVGFHPVDDRSHTTYQAPLGSPADAGVGACTTCAGGACCDPASPGLVGMTLFVHPRITAAHMVHLRLFVQIA